MSIQNIGRNKWRVVVKIANPTTGEVKVLDKRYNGTKEGAKSFESKLGGTPAASSDIKLKDYLDDVWLPTLKVEEATVEDYRYGISYLAAIWSVRLDRLNAFHIENTIHALKPGSQRHRARKTLSAALNAAVRWDMLASNPLAKAEITIGKGESRSYDAYSAEELLEVLNACKGHISEPVAILAAFCGLRKEEVLALDWEDINMESGTVTVNKAWVKSAGKIKSKDPKTAGSVRQVYISGNWLVRLKEIGEGKSGPLWPGIRRDRIRPDAANRTWYRHVTGQGLRYIPLGNLRHTYATVALAHGIDIGLVSKSMGHSRISTTVNAYIKPLEQARKDASVMFAEAIAAKAGF